MSLHAFGDVDDAVDATKNLLLPFEVRRWFYYALVAIFIGGGVTFPTTFGQSFTGDPPTTGPGTGGEIPDNVLFAIIAVVAVLFVVGVVLMLLSSVLQFVFFDALRTKDLEIRAGIRRYFGKGLRLFGFNLVLGIAAAAPIFLFVFAIVFSAAVFAPLLLLGLLAIPVLVLYYVALGVVGTFTAMFVVPLMVSEDRGVVSGWRRLWPAVRSNLKQFGAYVLMAFVLNLAVGFVAGLAALLVGIVLAIPFGVVFGALFVLLSGPAAFTGAFTVTPGLVVGAVGVFLYVVAFILAMGYVQAPLQAFVRYYAAFVLGDVAPDLDPIAAVRREVRADGGNGGDEGALGPDDGGDEPPTGRDAPGGNEDGFEESGDGFDRSEDDEFRGR